MRTSGAFSELAINNLRFDIRIGWSSAERLKKQPIEIDVFIRFAETPQACRNDEISGTFCYSSLCENIENHCVKRSFRLLEHLGFELYTLVQSQVGKVAKTRIRVRKIHPPVPRLLGGAAFSYGDWESN